MGMPFSSTGLWMRNVANAWQVYAITESAALLGLTFLFQGLPALIMGLFGGTLADIVDRRKLLLVGMSLEVCLALALGVLTVSGNIQVWHIYAITFASSSIASAEHPARAALIPSLVPRRLILNATVLQSTTQQISLLLGPILAGVVMSGLGTSMAYFLNAALVVPALVAILRIRTTPARGEGRVKLNVGAIFEGLLFAVRTRVLIAFLLLDTITMVLGYYPAMMPVFANDVFEVGPIGFGALLSAPAFGSILGFVAILAIGQVRRKGMLILAATVLHGIVLLLFAVSPWFLAALLLVAMLGLLDSMSVSVRQTSFQLLAPEHVRGRVVGLVYIFAVGSNSLGGTYLGLATALMGPRLAMGLGAAIAGGIALIVTATWRRVRDFEA